MPLAARILVLALALMAATCGQKGPLTPPAHSGLIDESQADRATEVSNAVTNGPAIEAAHSA